MNRDDLDGYEERMNPYKWECPKHGSGYGPIDECPKCMKEDYYDDLQHEWDGWELCLTCYYHNDKWCDNPKNKVQFRGRKKKCKWFQPEGVCPKHDVQMKFTQSQYDGAMYWCCSQCREEYDQKEKLKND